MSYRATQNTSIGTVSRRHFVRTAAILGGAAITAGALNSAGAGLGQLFGEGAERAYGLEREMGRGANLADGRGRAAMPAKTALAAKGTLSREGVASRLAIISDAHLAADDTAAADKLALAWQTLATVAPGIDAAFVLGDVSYDGSAASLEAFAAQTAVSLFEHFAAVPPVHVLMGNHDWLGCTQQEFEALFATTAFAALFVGTQNSVAVVPGATIIKLNGTGSLEVDAMDYTVAYDFLAAALAEAAAQRPDDALLIMAHEPPEGTSLASGSETGNFGQGTARDLVELIARYPQARLFSGHLHNPLDLPESVNFDLGFASVHTSTVGSCFFVHAEQVDYDQDGSHGLVLDVMTDGRLLLHRLDFTQQEYLGEALAI